MGKPNVKSHLALFLYFSLSLVMLISCLFLAINMIFFIASSKPVFYWPYCDEISLFPSVYS